MTPHKRCQLFTLMQTYFCGLFILMRTNFCGLFALMRTNFCGLFALMRTNFCGLFALMRTYFCGLVGLQTMLLRTQPVAPIEMYSFNTMTFFCQWHGLDLGLYSHFIFFLTYQWDDGINMLECCIIPGWKCFPVTNTPAYLQPSVMWHSSLLGRFISSEWVLWIQSPMLMPNQPLFFPRDSTTHPLMN